VYSFFAGATTVALAATALIGLGTPASAAPSDVTITNYGFTHTEFPDGTSQEVKIDFSVEGPASPTVSFTVPMPDGVAGENRTITLTDGDGNQTGECVVTAEKMTCTLDDDYVTENPYDLHGEVKFAAHTTYENKTEENHTIDWGDVEQEITVGPNPNWCTDNCDFKGVGDGKWGSYNNDDDTIIWTVQIKAPAEGLPAGQHVTVIDDLDTSVFTLAEDSSFPRVHEGRSLSYDKWGRQGIDYVRMDSGRYTVSPNGLVVDFDTVAGLGNNAPEGHQGTDGSFYYVQWKVKVLDEGKAKTYKNLAHYTLSGVESNDINGSATRYEYSGTAVGRNFGKFRVTKELTGDTTLNPTFKVTYTSELDGEVKEGSFNINAGGTYVSGEFFKGTKIVLKEIKPVDPSNVEWSDPVFLDQDGNEASTIEFSTANGNVGKLTEIRLVNKATLQKAPFQAKKTVEVNDPIQGGRINTPESYTLNYSYPADKEKGFVAGSGTLTLLSDGTIAKSADLPTGAVLTLTESSSAPGASAVSSVSPSTITIGQDSEATVSVVNTFTRDLGGFSVSKNLKGDGQDLVPGEEYKVTYSYPANIELGFPAAEGSLIVKAGEGPISVQGLPAGAEVTLEEIAPVDKDNASWQPPVWSTEDGSAPRFTIVKDATATFDLDNEIEFDRGTFSLVKAISGSGSELVPADAVFNIHFSAKLPDGYTAGDDDVVEGVLTIQADGTAVNGPDLPAGTVVMLAEESPSTVAGGTWGKPKFSAEEFTIQDPKGGEPITTAISVTNTIELDLGSIEVRKSVVGSGAGLVPKDTEFALNYSYEAGAGFEAGKGQIKVKANGEGATIDGLPAGAVVVFEEVAPAKVPGTTWQPVIFPDGDRIVVGKDETAVFKLENTADLSAGQFSILKSLAGTAKDSVDPGLTYTVQYSYPAGKGFEAGRGFLEVKADGLAVSSGLLPYGAHVTLEEQPAESLEGREWKAPTFSQTQLVIGEDTKVEIGLTNTIDKIVPPTTTPPTVSPSTEQPTATPETDTPPSSSPGHLVNTGANAGWPLSFGLAFLGIGALVLLTVTRRRRHG
jgi:hypothetical protein